MKNVILIGANGHTAREIIPRVLEQKDVKLTLFLRQADRLRSFTGPRVAIQAGDARNPDDLKAAMKGQHIVLSAMGGMDLDVKTANVLHAMKEAGVVRVTAISAGGVYDELPEPFNSWDKSMVGQTRPVNLRTAEMIEASTLEYTVLRPVWLTNKSIEAFQLTAKGQLYRGTETSRASLGRFVADIVRNPDLHIRANLGISQANTDGDKPAAYR